MGRRTIGLLVAGLISITFATLYGLLRASLPPLDGAITAPTLHAVVTIERDALGIPTVAAGDRVDLAYGTGFVHGQDRFFQMDLSRRLAAGELAEIFGRVAVEQDRKTRLFRFRRVARAVLAEATPEQRSILTAYARGVNAGLASLGSRPFEYWLLRSAPRAWNEEDSILIVYAMWWDLQYGGFERERVRREIDARLQGPQCAAGWKCALRFLYPARTSWDAPMEPRPDVAAAASASALSLTPTVSVSSAPMNSLPYGSNNWALAGRLTATGSALVANDMHLGLRVPTVWYRARLVVAPRSGEAALDLNGVTLPGAPFLVAGSNGRVAWGFTNSYGKWLDLQPADCGSVRVTEDREEIRVRGAPSVMLPIESAAIGVLFEVDRPARRCWFARWLAQVPAATNLNLQALETASSVEQVLALAPSIGIPHQNVVVGDAQGHIGWTIFGRIPMDTGPQRASGRASWTTALEQPHLLDPLSGRVWSANARSTDDPNDEVTIGGEEAALGADYNLGARARQIRDDLNALAAHATTADMLRIQLDDRALFLTRWRGLILDLLPPQALRDHPERAQFKRLVADWNARASVDSVGYRLVREYRDRTEWTVWSMILRSAGIAEPAPPPLQFEQPLWELLTQRPAQSLAGAASWNQLLLAALDATIGELKGQCGELARCTWGARHLVRVHHPLSAALPIIGALLDMPSLELPGDHDMPRVQDGAFGASERFAVSPGHEAQGYLHIAGGQSGHPLSPYYRAGFREWADGKPLPFLPGAGEHRLTLQPGSR